MDAPARVAASGGGASQSGEDAPDDTNADRGPFPSQSGHHSTCAVSNVNLTHPIASFSCLVLCEGVFAYLTFYHQWTMNAIPCNPTTDMIIASPPLISATMSYSGSALMTCRGPMSQSAYTIGEHPPSHFH
jgi:hypothetical protein